MNQNLSLLKYCIPCKSSCCKAGNLIGSPILSKEEKSKIEKYIGSNKCFKEIITKSGKKYYIIIEQQGTNKCFFLTNENKCKIQNVKPLDCLCYPIKAVYDGKSVKYVIDTNCPASKHLSNEFIKNAKSTALKSIKCFDEQTYEHWLNRCDIWAKKRGMELNQFLKIFK